MGSHCECEGYPNKIIRLLLKFLEWGFLLDLTVAFFIIKIMNIKFYKNRNYKLYGFSWIEIDKATKIVLICFYKYALTFYWGKF